MGMPETAFADPTWPLRQADECFLFNANNLRKSSLGNVLYGAMTSVLTPQGSGEDASLRGLGRRAFIRGQRERLLSRLRNATASGTIECKCTRQSSTFPIPRGGMCQMTLVTTTPWLTSSIAGGCQALRRQPVGIFSRTPTTISWWLVMCGSLRDMLYGLAKHSDMDCNTDVRHVGQWSTAAGAQLRAFLQAAGRPLIWADSDDSEMLIDPTVGNIVGGRITAADIAGWEALW